MTPRDFGFAVQGYRRRVERSAEMVREVGTILVNVNRDSKERPDGYRPAELWPYSIDPPEEEKQSTFRLLTEDEFAMLDRIEARNKEKKKAKTKIIIP